MPLITLVVAAADNGVIGFNGQMPWHLPADLSRFRQLTSGHPVIMGRKTFQSIGRPLPKRHNIVLSRASDWSADGVNVAGNLPDALALATAGPWSKNRFLVWCSPSPKHALRRPA